MSVAALGPKWAPKSGAPKLYKKYIAWWRYSLNSLREWGKFIGELHGLTTHVKILTIAYGGILQMFCVGFTETYTMAVPLQVLKSLAADQSIKVAFYGNIDRINCL